MTASATKRCTRLRRREKVLGRKRHLVVDTLGLLWALVVTPADVQDRDGAKFALAAFRELHKSPGVICADTACLSVVGWAWIR
ncbi:MAG: transposase [Planctomycetota bacterium]